MESLYINMVFYCVQILYRIVISIDCPSNKHEWSIRAMEIQCSSGEKYHCGVLVSGTVGEFCFEPAAVVPNFCPRFDVLLKKGITMVECNGEECPTSHYLTSNLYLYPRCFSLTLQGQSTNDFLSTSKSLVDNATTLYEPEEEKTKRNLTVSYMAVSENQTTINVLEEENVKFSAEMITNSEGKTIWTIPVIVTIGSSVSLFFVTLLIVAVFVLKRKKRRNQKRITTKKSVTPTIETLNEDENGYQTIADVGYHNIAEVEAKLEEKANINVAKEKDPLETDRTNQISASSLSEYYPVQRKEQKSLYTKIAQEGEMKESPDLARKSSLVITEGYEEPIVNKYERLLPFSRSDIESSEYCSVQPDGKALQDTATLTEKEDGTSLKETFSDEYCPLQRKIQDSPYTKIEHRDVEDLDETESQATDKENLSGSESNKYEQLLPFSRSDVETSEYNLLEKESVLNEETSSKESGDVEIGSCD